MADSLAVLLVLGATSGGIGSHVRSLAGALVGLGHSVTVVGPASTDDLFDWSSTGAAFVPAPVGAPSPVAVVRSRRVLRSSASVADVVHAHGTRVGAVAALAGVHPLVVT